MHFADSKGDLKEKEGTMYMNYDLTRLIAARGQICFPFAACSNFSLERAERALHAQVKMFAQKS